jgi:hypothetical protein
MPMGLDVVLPHIFCHNILEFLELEGPRDADDVTFAGIAFICLEMEVPNQAFLPRSPVELMNMMETENLAIDLRLLPV